MLQYTFTKATRKYYQLRQRNLVGRWNSEEKMNVCDGICENEMYGSQCAFMKGVKMAQTINRNWTFISNYQILSHISRFTDKINGMFKWCLNYGCSPLLKLALLTADTRFIHWHFTYSWILLQQIFNNGL